MSDSTRRRLNIVVLVMAVGLTVVNVVDLANGDASAWVWIGLGCWLFVAFCSAYELATHKRLHV